MSDFINKAQKAAHGPPSNKAKPAESDSSRANKVKDSTSLGAIKGRVVGSSAVSGNKTKNTGSSAGLRNETSAILEPPGGSYAGLSKREYGLGISQSPAKSPEHLGKRSVGRNVRVTDYNKRGQGTDRNSAARLESRMKLNNMFK